jgi:NDP-sugar pyrophosphorylase family protein
MARAVILAGGRGTRLRPYSVSLPKPLMPIVDRPILEIIIRQLARRGFDHVTLAVNHQAELLKAYFGDGSRWGVRIDYSLETEPLSTMGPLRLVRELPENFLVMNGDILTDLNYRTFVDTHAAERRLFTIAAAAREQMIDYGVLQVTEQLYLRGFQEKPSIPYLVSMGIYGVNRRVLDFIPAEGPFGFDQLVVELLARQEPVRVEPHEGYWLDIGRPDDYQKAVEDWPKMSAELEL